MKYCFVSAQDTYRTNVLAQFFHLSRNPSAVNQPLHENKTNTFRIKLHAENLCIISERV